VIGVVGTIFLIEALPNLTRVYCLEGIITVRNIDLAVLGEVTLHAGEFTSVPKGLAPVTAGTASAANLQSEIEQSQLQPAPTVAGAQPPSGGGVGAKAPAGRAGAFTGATKIAGLAAVATGATSAGLSAAANSKAGQANDALLGATSMANAALASATNAAAAAAQASAADSHLPPSCGCH
jgi:hypothetical protein